MSKFASPAMVLGVILLGLGPSGAFIYERPTYEGPWCVLYNAGADVVQENCAMPSFEACNVERSHWGSTAFCHQNPRFAGYWGQPGLAPEPRHRKSRHRHRR